METYNEKIVTPFLVSAKVIEENRVLTEENLQQSKADNCLYTYKKILSILVDVDDILVISSNKSEVERIQKTLKNNFDIDIELFGY